MFAELNKTQPILRVHQEDLCQAMGLMPTEKHQNEGGPSPAQIAVLLQAHSSRPADDVTNFVDALAYNWLVAGTNAHAKNYSLLHGGGGRVRLAPLYDLASTLPYDDLDPHRVTMAMKIGSKYRIRDVTGQHWRKLAEELQLDPDETIDRVAAMAHQLPDAAREIGIRLRDGGLDNATVQRLAEELPERAEDCVDRLQRK
jgi:serine/threonine-protein kinase HipA